MLISFQQTISATGTPQNLPNNPVNRAVTISAKAGNTASIELGNASSVTTGTGFILAPGESVAVELAGGNTAEFWGVGTSGDTYSVIGN